MNRPGRGYVQVVVLAAAEGARDADGIVTNNELTTILSE